VVEGKQPDWQPNRVPSHPGEGMRTPQTSPATRLASALTGKLLVRFPALRASFVCRSRLPGRGKEEPVRAAISAWRQRPPPYRTQPVPRLLKLGGRRGNLSVGPRKTLAPPLPVSGRPSSRRA
jgi:hypothetical protein